MRTAEKDRISRTLSDVVGRLKSLRQQDITPFPRWPSIEEWRKLAYSLFGRAIEAFMGQCESYLKNLDTIHRTFEQWCFILDALWDRCDRLRTYHNRLFYYDYSTVIYHHVFISEMFDCLPQTLSGARIKFLLVPSGELVVWIINEEFADLSLDWFDKQYRIDFKEIAERERVISFECHREQNFERQAVLAHEIFHIIARNNQDLVNTFVDLAKIPQVKSILSTSDPDLLISQIEELFCDFAASWYYGPIYLQAFADEISYFPADGSYTHPPSDLRAKFLYVANSSIAYHKAFRSLKTYLELHGGTTVSRELRSAFATIRKAFSKCITNLGLQQFKYEDYTEPVVKSFNSNVPYVVEDIRTLINNLPPMPGNREKYKFYEFVSESLRKTNILRQVKGYFHKPGLLFVIPPPLSSSETKPSNTGG